MSERLIFEPCRNGGVTISYHYGGGGSTHLHGMKQTSSLKALVEWMDRNTISKPACATLKEPRSHD